MPTQTGEGERGRRVGLLRSQHLGWGSWHSSPSPHRFGECRPPTPRTGSWDVWQRVAQPWDPGSAGGPGCEPLPSSLRGSAQALGFSCSLCLALFAAPDVSFLMGSSFSVCQTDSPASGSNALAPGGHVRGSANSDPEKDQWPPAGRAKARGAGERWLRAQTTGGK